MTQREFYINNPEYYNWVTKAEQSGLVYRLAEEYYKYTDIDIPYQYKINGERYIVPVFFDYDWIQPRKLSSVLYHYDSDPSVKHDDSSLKEIARRSAITEHNRGGYVSEYLWNNPTIGVNKIMSGSKGLSTQLTDYYTVRSTSSQFNNELYQTAYNCGLSPKTSRKEITNNLHDMNFPVRDTSYGKNIIIESDQPFLLGQTTMTIFNTTDGLYYPIEYRNNRVTESPGWENVIPTGVVQPEVEPNSDLQTGYTQISLNDILYKKATSELFNHNYSAEQLQKDETNDKLSYITLGYGIDAVNSHIHLYNLLYIHDTELADTLISKTAQAWGSEYISLNKLSNKYKLQNLIGEKTMIPYNIPAVVESLQYLQNNGVKLPIAISRDVQ